MAAEEPKGSRPSLGADPLLELIGQLKRSFSIFRLYGVAHDTSRASEQQLFEKLTAYLDQNGSLCLVLDATSLKVDDRKVLEDDRKEESLVRALFVDGVESITFLAEVSREEFLPYLHAWYDAISGALGSEYSFSTFVWEQDFQSIFTAVRQGLSDNGIEDGLDPKAAEGRLQQLHNQMIGAARLAARDGGMAVDVSTLGVVKHVLGDASASDFQATAEAPPATLPELAKSDRTALISGLGSSARGAGQRALYALWQWFPPASPEMRQSISEFAARIVADLTREGRMREVSRALVRVVEMAEVGPDLEDFLACLCDPDVVRDLVHLVEDPAAAQDALTLLKYLPESYVDALSEPFALAAPDVRHRLVQVLAQKRPSGELLASWLMTHGAGLVGSLFELADQLDQDAQDFLIRAALIHDTPEVVLKGLSKVKPDWMPQFRSLVEPRLHHEQAEIRRAALNAFIWAKDEIVPTLLESQLADPNAPDEVKKMCIRGLAAFGGPSAASLLSKILTTDRSRQLRVAAALALSSVDDPTAWATLEKEGARLFGDRAVKQACRESLRRLAQRRAGVVPSEPPPTSIPPDEERSE